MTLTAGQLRLDLKCGSGHIAQGKKCRKGVGAPNNIAQAPAPPSTASSKTSRSTRGRKIAIGAALAGATALGAGLAVASSRKQILNAPEAVRRAAQRGVTEVVHRTTASEPSMKFSTEGTKAMVKDLKKKSLRRKVMLTMEAARRKQEPGYRKPPFQLTAGLMREPRKGGKQRSLLRTAQLTMEAARRKQEPGYRKPARGAKRKDESSRFDVKCGASGISKGEKCHKGTGQFTGVTSDLHKATSAQLDHHRKQLVADMQKRYGKPITNEEQMDDWMKFARKQPEYAELEEVARITAKRKLRRKAVAGAAAVGGALVAGALLRGKRKDAFVGNDKKLKCGPNSKPCGNACIPKNHRCRASWNKPVKALKAGAVIAGAGLVGTALFHKRANMRAAAAGLGEPVMHGGFALGNIAMGNKAQAAKNAANAMSSAQNFRKNVATLRKGYGQDVGSVYAAAKRAVFKARHHRQARG